MASIVLEPVNPQEAPEVEEATEEPPAEPAEQEEATEPPADPVEEEILAPLETAEPPPPAPAPKKRGRPPKAKAEPKAAPGLPKAKPAPKPKPRARKAPPPESDSDSSSDVEETLKNVYRHVAKPDMETAILEFLVNRKQSEQTRRRELWSQLAKF